MTSSLDLSKRLRALDDDQLRTLIEHRVGHVSAIKDYFDLADALLSEQSLHAALQRIPAPLLSQLASGERPSAELASLLNAELLNSEVGVYPEVADYLSTLSIPVTTPLKVTGGHVSDMKATAALEHSLGVVSSLEDIIGMLATVPAKRLAKGGLNVQDSQRLSAALSSGQSQLEDLLTLGELAGLTSRVPGWWLPGQAVTQWLELPLAKKWEVLALGFEQNLSPAVRSALTTTVNWGQGLEAWVEHTYPLGHDWIDADLSQARTHAHLLGLEVDECVTVAGQEVLSGDLAAAATRVAAVIPAYAQTVFVQHDFTVIAPAPLEPAAEKFMRQLCHIESRGIASTYRITSEGVNSLVASGMSAEDIVAQLNKLAGTAIPQAVSYFITDLGERFGSITVTAGNGGALVSASDQMVLRTIAADRSLAALGLRKYTESSLSCSHSAEVVLNALLEAKYPAQLVDGTGRVLSVRAATPRIEIDPASPSTTTVVIQRLRGSREAGHNDDATWIARQLDLAVRNKTVLIVTVSMPDGEREFTIEPKGFANGRLRCLDRTTDVERTLPASHITAVRHA